VTRALRPASGRELLLGGTCFCPSDHVLTTGLAARKIVRSGNVEVAERLALVRHRLSATHNTRTHHSIRFASATRKIQCPSYPTAFLASARIRYLGITQAFRAQPVFQIRAELSFRFQPLGLL